MRVAILDDYQGVALDSADWSALEARAELLVYRDHLANEDALVERLVDAEIVVAMRERTPFERSLVERLPNLRLLITTGARNASFDLEALRDAGVTVCGTGGRGAATAELTWGLILALMRGIPLEHAAIDDGRWQLSLGRDLGDKTLGVIGLGRLGSQVATVGRAFGMPVLAWSQNLTRERTDELGVELARSLDDLLDRADVATIHLVLSARTRGLIGTPELARLGSDAYPREHLARPDRGRDGACGGAARRDDRGCGVGRLRRGAVAGGAPADRPRKRRADAAHRLRDGGDVRGVLPRRGRGHRRVPRWFAGARDRVVSADMRVEVR